MALTKVQLVDLNSNELILDLDADTSLHSSTDDQIDIKIGGADDFTFTANTFTALAGSSIVVPDSGLTLGSTAVTSTAAELNLLDGVSGLVQADLTKLAALDATAAEINLIDGGTSTGTTAVADADGIITNDGGTMRLTTAATFKTYFQEGISTAYDDLTAGDAAVLITTSSGNITIDAAASDSDIIFKGTDGGADRVFMTIDGSAGGDLFLTGGLIDLKNDGSAVSQIKFYCESSNAHAQTLIGAPHSESANNVLTLPGTGGDARLVSTASTATLTNKTLTSPVINTGTFGTSILPTSADGTTLGSASKEFSDLFLADASTIQFGADQDVTLTHVADTGLLLNAAMKIQFRDAAIHISSTADGDLAIAADDEVDITSTLIDVNGNLDVSGTIVGASTLSATTGTFSGILKTDDATDATSTTDGSLQTDGGLSVAKDTIIGNDLKLLSDSAVLVFGAGSDATLTHTNDVGLTLNSTNKLMFNDASQFIQGASATVLDIAATDEIELTATLIEVVGNATVSGTLGVTGVTTSNAGVVVDNITIDGTEIDLSSGDLLIDVAGDITFDAGGGDFDYHVAGTEILKIAGDSSNVIIKSTVSDKDITIQGNDGGAAINALAFDMSAAGKATFNDDIVLGTAGKGIYLGVTSATAANLLDDYEEGTWTPTFNRSSSQITIAILRANYTKIGRLVHVTMHAVNNDGAKNNAHIVGDGLPFTSAAINVLGVGGTFAIHPGSGNSNNDVGAAGSWTQDNDWYMVPSHNGSNGYRYLYDWANGAYIEVAFWYYAA